MADVFTKAKRSEIMSRIRSTDTKLEVLFRKALLHAGLKHKKNAAKLMGKPDVAIPKLKFAVFIDSCFWHGCRYHSHIPKSNKKYWVNKIARNKARDKEVNKHYKKEGWLVIRVWEHSMKKNLDAIVQDITNKLKLL